MRTHTHAKLQKILDSIKMGDLDAKKRGLRDDPKQARVREAKMLIGDFASRMHAQIFVSLREHQNADC